MAVKVIINRRVPSDLASNIKPLLLQLRGLASEQPGYVSGETLINVDDHEEFVVLSTWRTIDQWKTWQSDPRRTEIEGSVEAMIGSSAHYQAYFSG